MGRVSMRWSSRQRMAMEAALSSFLKTWYVCLPRHLMVVKCGAITSLRLPLQPLVRPWQSPIYTFSSRSPASGVKLQCQYSWQNLA